MNKFAKVMCLIAVVALAFTSCKKKEDPQSFKMHGTTEQFTEIFDEENGEKAYLDGSNVMQFETDDEIVVFNMGTTTQTHCKYAYVSEYDWTAMETVPSGFGMTDGDFYAFYPASSVVGYDLANGKATFQLHAQQNYRELGGKVAVPLEDLYMAAKDADNNDLDNAYFNFRNICGVLSMRFFSPTGKSIRKIEITDKKFNIVGDVTCKLDKINPDELTSLFSSYQDTESYHQTLANYLQTIGYSVENGSKTVTLDCGNGVTLGRTSAKATRFLVVMRPLALVQGCTIKITFTNGTTKTINSSKDNRISPNVIRNMTTVSVG